jgi:hypothetical protein
MNFKLFGRLFLIVWMMICSVMITSHMVRTTAILDNPFLWFYDWLRFGLGQAVIALIVSAVLWVVFAVLQGLVDGISRKSK